MGRFTGEETNLICIYIVDTRTELIEKITGALPFVDTSPYYILQFMFL